MDARTLSTGEVVFRDSLAHGVAGIVQADYCLDGREQLIVVSVGGEVRGYLPASAELRQQVADATFEQDTVRELSHKKQASRRGISWQLYFRTSNATAGRNKYTTARGSQSNYREQFLSFPTWYWWLFFCSHCSRR